MPQFTGVSAIRLMHHPLSKNQNVKSQKSRRKIMLGEKILYLSKADIESVNLGMAVPTKNAVLLYR